MIKKNKKRLSTTPISQAVSLPLSVFFGCVKRHSNYKSLRKKIVDLGDQKKPSHNTLLRERKNQKIKIYYL